MCRYNIKNISYFILLIIYLIPTFASAFTISGRIIWIDNTSLGVEGVTVNLTGAATASDVTDARGYYSFTGLSTGNYTVRPTYSNADSFNGVTSADVSLIASHLAGTQLSTMYKWIAADINKSNSITATDQSLLNSALSGGASALSFLNNNRWRFTRSNVTLPNPPWGFSESYAQSVSSDTTFDFYGVKIGDLNASADPGSPTIDSVTTTTGSGTYTLGEVIPITITFSEVVTSTGDVTVTLETGAVDRICTFSVTSSTTGTCNYTVQASDATSDLSVSSVSGTISDSVGTAMTDFSILTNINDSKDIVIVPSDITAPTITNISSDKANGAYSVGEIIDIDVTFSEAVTSTGNVTVTLETGTTDRSCTFTVTNSTTGTCNYTVEEGDASADLSVAEVSGVINDQYSNTMNDFVPVSNLATNKALVIDTVAPTVSSVVATPSSNGVVITWTTDEISSSFVSYGIANVFIDITNEADTSPRVLSHEVTISNLISCTTYHYRVKSKDSALNLVTESSNNFTTTGCTANASVESEDQAHINSASGGSLSLLASSYGLSLNVPVGATNTNAVFQIKKLNRTIVLAAINAPSSKSLMGTHIYELKSLSGISASNTSFNDNITVTITYSDSDISGYDESSLRIYRYASETWNALSGCDVNTATNTVSCTTASFSPFGLFGSVASSSSSAPAGAVPIWILQNINKKSTPTETICPFGDLFSTATGLPCTVYTNQNNSLLNQFTKDLYFRIRHPEVKLLQTFLNSNGYVVSSVGPGSAGNETDYFGVKTKKALVRFQKENNINPAVGFFGVLTRQVVKEKLKELHSSNF